MNNAIRIIGKSSTSRPRVEQNPVQAKHTNNVNWIVDTLRKRGNRNLEASVMINLGIAGIKNYGDLRRQMLNRNPETVYSIRKAMGG